MYYKRKQIGYSGHDWWKWFDMMPKAVREQINNAKDMDEAFYLWQDAINKYGDDIEGKINGQSCDN